MRTRLQAVATALGAVCLVSAFTVSVPAADSKKDKSGAKASATERMIAENRELDRRFTDALTRRDVAGLMATYHNGPELRVVGPDGNVAVGFDQVHKFMQDWLGSLESIRAEFVEANYIPAGDAVLGTGIVVVTEKAPNGREQSRRLRFTDLRRKMNGSWYYVYDQVTPLAGGAMAGESLYKRLGGYDGIAAVVDEFVVRLATDPQASRFFKGLSASSQARLRQHVVDQLCQVSGGPCLYTGRDMRTAHTGLMISESDWDAGVRALQGAFDKYNVGQRERTEVLSALSGLKADIVGR